MTATVVSCGVRFWSREHLIKLTTRYTLFIILFLANHLLLSHHYCFAEDETIITSETLEYFADTSTYVAKGSVKIQEGNRVIESDEMSYHEQTSEIIASGNVRYDDPEIAITADKVELNLETETGSLYDAEILYKRDNYHVSGREIEKRGEDYYFSPEADFTTCDAPVPAWCFKGKDIDIRVGKRLKAKHASFRIKNVPVFYFPYLYAPINTERRTGFLFPVLDYSSLRGMHVGIPFFWAISENRDATLFVDTYTKRGIGEGLEYRYVEPGDIEGNWWLYHIRDTKLDKDFFEFRTLHEQRPQEGMGGYLSINYVNRSNFYREFNPYLEIRTQRFLESTGEISVPFTNSRLYLLSQYWVDLKEEVRPPPQRLPEIGYVLNPTKVGDFWFSSMATVSHFWRDEGIFGQRIDVFPRIMHKFGNEVMFTQALGFRETAYFLQRSEDNSLHREAIEYSAIAHTRFLKQYDSFTHTVEPSLGYTLITDSESLPLFDSAELFEKTSRVEFSLVNRFLKKGREYVIMRATQGFDSNRGDRPFLPLRLEVGIKRPVFLRFDANYDVHKGRVESINSDMRVKVSKAAIWIGQRYNELEDITLFKAGIELQPSKPWYMNSRIWYDVRENEVRDLRVDVKYMSQCWGVTMSFNKRPRDYTVALMFELRGIASGFKI